jgi:hypothetical protein
MSKWEAPPMSPSSGDRKDDTTRSRRRNKGVSDKYQVTAHVLDTLLKHEAEYLADALSSHFGLRLAPIAGPFPTEFPQLDLHLERLDTVFLFGAGVSYAWGTGPQ